MQRQIQLLTGLRVKQVVGRQVSLEGLGGLAEAGRRGIKMQPGRADDPETGTAGQEMGWVQMVGMGVRLQAVAQVRQRPVVHLRGGHDIWAEIDQ